MSVLKYKELAKMDAKGRETKLAELRFELLKARSPSSKTRGKTKEIKKAIARLLTFAHAQKTVRSQ